jgi:hypothetical protein
MVVIRSRELGDFNYPWLHCQFGSPFLTQGQRRSSHFSGLTHAASQAAELSTFLSRQAGWGRPTKKKGTKKTRGFLFSRAPIG